MHFVVVSSCFILVKKYKIMRASLYRHLWTFFLCEEEGVPPYCAFIKNLSSSYIEGSWYKEGNKED